MTHRDERLMDFRQWLRSVSKFLHLILWSSWTLCSDDAVIHKHTLVLSLHVLWGLSIDIMIFILHVQTVYYIPLQ